MSFVDDDSDCEIIENTVAVVCIPDNSDDEFDDGKNGTPNIRRKINLHEQHLAIENLQKSPFQPIFNTHKNVCSASPTRTQTTNYENIFKPILAADNVPRAELHVINKPRIANNYAANRKFSYDSGSTVFNPRQLTENSKSPQSLRTSQQSGINLDDVFRVRFVDNALNSKSTQQMPKQTNRNIPQHISIKEQTTIEPAKPNQQTNIEDVFKPKFDTSNLFNKTLKSPKKLPQQQMSQLQNVDNAFQPRLAKSNEQINATIMKPASAFNNQNAKTVDFQNVFKPRLANENKKLNKIETVTHSVAEANNNSTAHVCNDIFKPRLQADRKSMSHSPQAQSANKPCTSTTFQDVFNVRFAVDNPRNDQQSTTTKSSPKHNNIIEISSSPEHRKTPQFSVNINSQNKSNNTSNNNNMGQNSAVVDLCGSSPDSSNEVEGIFKPKYMVKSPKTSIGDRRTVSNVIEICSSPEEEILKPSTKRDFYGNEKNKINTLQSFSDAFKPKLAPVNTTVDISSSPEPERSPKTSKQNNSSPKTVTALQKQNSNEIDFQNTFQVRLACNIEETDKSKQITQNSTTLSKNIHAESNKLQNAADNTLGANKSPKATPIDYENAFQVRLADNTNAVHGNANKPEGDPFKDTNKLHCDMPNLDAQKQCSGNKNIKNDLNLQQCNKTTPQKEINYVDVFKPRLADIANGNNCATSLKPSPPQTQISPQPNSVGNNFSTAETPCRVPNPFNIYNQKQAIDYKDVFKPRMAVDVSEIKETSISKPNSPSAPIQPKTKQQPDNNLMKVSSSLSLCKRKQEVINYDDVFKPRLAVVADKSKETDDAATDGGSRTKLADPVESIIDNVKILDIENGKEASKCTFADDKQELNNDNTLKAQTAVNENNACSESLVSSSSDTKLEIGNGIKNTVDGWCKEAKEGNEMANNYTMAWETEDSADSHCLTIDERMCENIETDEEVINKDNAAVVVDDDMNCDEYGGGVNKDKQKTEQMQTDELDDVDVDVDVDVETNNDEEKATDTNIILTDDISARIQTPIYNNEDEDDIEIIEDDVNLKKKTIESNDIITVESLTDEEKTNNKKFDIKNDKSVESESICIDEDEDDIKIVEDNENLVKESCKSAENMDLPEVKEKQASDVTTNIDVLELESKNIDGNNKTKENNGSTKIDKTELVVVMKSNTDKPSLQNFKESAKNSPSSPSFSDYENVFQVPYATTSAKNNTSESSISKINKVDEKCESTINISTAEGDFSSDVYSQADDQKTQIDIAKQQCSNLTEMNNKVIDKNIIPNSLIKNKLDKDINDEQIPEAKVNNESKEHATLILQVLQVNSKFNYENPFQVPLATTKEDNEGNSSAIIKENKTVDDLLSNELKDDTILIEDVATLKENTAASKSTNANEAINSVDNQLNDDYKNVFHIPLAATNNNSGHTSTEEQPDNSVNNIDKQKQNKMNDDKVSNSETESMENVLSSPIAYDEIMEPRLAARNDGSDNERSAQLQPDVFVIDSDIEEGEVHDVDDMNDSSLQIIDDNNDDDEAIQVDTLDDSQVEIERTPIFEIIFPQKHHFDKLSAKIVQALTESLNAVTCDNEAYELIEYSADLSIQGFEIQTKIKHIEHASLPMPQPAPMTLDSDEKEQLDSLLFTIDTAPAEKIDAARVPSYKKAIRDPLNDEATPSKRLKQDEDHCVRPRTQSCFNCGSNEHSIRDCTKRRNMKRIKIAKQKHLSKQERYHMDTEQRFAHLRPGAISKKLKSALGLERGEIPPFFYRMRVFGYPPGWLEDAKIASSGLALFVDKDKEVPVENLDEGELDEQVKYDIRKIIDFPGFNTDPGDNFYDDFKFHCVPPMHPTHMKEQFITMLGDNVYKGYKQKKLKELPTSDTAAETIEITIEDMDIEDSGQLNDEIIETERPPAPIGSPPRDEIPPPPPLCRDLNDTPPPPPPFCRDLNDTPPPPPPFSNDLNDTPPPPPPICRDLNDTPPPPPPFFIDNELPPPPPSVFIKDTSRATTFEKHAQNDDDNNEEAVCIGGVEQSENCDTIEEGKKSPSLADLEAQQERLLSELETAGNANCSTDHIQQQVTNDLNKNESQNDNENEIVNTNAELNVSLNSTASNPEQPAIEANTAETPTTPVTPIASQRLVRESHVGTPLCKFSPYDKLPCGENFKVGVSDVINFENLPDSTGKYEKMKGVLKKVRNIVTELHKREDD